MPQRGQTVVFFKVTVGVMKNEIALSFQRCQLIANLLVGRRQRGLELLQVAVEFGSTLRHKFQ